MVLIRNAARFPATEAQQEELIWHTSGADLTRFRAESGNGPSVLITTYAVAAKGRLDMDTVSNLVLLDANDATRATLYKILRHVSRTVHLLAITSPTYRWGDRDAPLWALVFRKYAKLILNLVPESFLASLRDLLGVSLTSSAPKYLAGSPDALVNYVDRHYSWWDTRGPPLEVTGQLAMYEYVMTSAGKISPQEFFLVLKPPTSRKKSEKTKKLLAFTKEEKFFAGIPFADVEVFFTGAKAPHLTRLNHHRSSTKEKYFDVSRLRHLGA